MKSTLPVALSLNAGFVDTLGFLSLHRLFTAHVTGNFVTLGAVALQGTSGALIKTLALPVFCLPVVVTRVVRTRLDPHLGNRATVLLMTAQALLLLAATGTAIAFGPFEHADSGTAFLTGMLLVAAMAILNALRRIDLTDMPPSTLMTGTTTQVMIDMSDLLPPEREPQVRQTAQSRLKKLVPNLIAFGCGAVAVGYAAAGVWAFVLPPLFALYAVSALRQRITQENA